MNFYEYYDHDTGCMTHRIRPLADCGHLPTFYDSVGHMASRKLTDFTSVG